METLCCPEITKNCPKQSIRYKVVQKLGLCDALTVQSSHFCKSSKFQQFAFDGTFQDILRIQAISKDFRGYQEISGDIKKFHRILKIQWDLRNKAGLRNARILMHTVHCTAQKRIVHRFTYSDGFHCIASRVAQVVLALGVGTHCHIGCNGEDIDVLVAVGTIRSCRSGQKLSGT